MKNKMGTNLKIFLNYSQNTFILFLLIGCWGCCKKNVENELTLSQKYKDISISLYQGGGFTGYKYGFRFESTGEVADIFSKPGSPDSMRVVGNNQDSVLKYLHLFYTNKFDTLKYDYPGNMSCMLVIKSKDSVVQNLQWGLGDKNVPEDVKKYFYEINKFGSRFITPE